MGKYLYHFSEDPTIDVFVPHVAPTQQIEGAHVWADDPVNQPRYWFPRDCPRATWWPRDEAAWNQRHHAIQWDWFDAFCATTVYAYTFDAGPFRPNPGGGGWITQATVKPLDVQPIGPLLELHRNARIELRLVDDLWALWLDVIERAGIEFSGIRLKNLPQHPDSRA